MKPAQETGALHRGTDSGFILLNRAKRNFAMQALDGVGIMIEPLFNNFATAAFLEFVVFAIFEMRFLMTVWRARRIGQAETWQARLI